MLLAVNLTQSVQSLGKEAWVNWVPARVPCPNSSSFLTKIFHPLTHIRIGSTWVEISYDFSWLTWLRLTDNLCEAISSIMTKLDMANLTMWKKNMALIWNSFCHMDRSNSIKKFVSYKSVNWFWLNLPLQMAKSGVSCAACLNKSPHQLKYVKMTQIY